MMRRRHTCAVYHVALYVYDDVTYVYDDVTYVYDDVTYVYDDVTYVYDETYGCRRSLVWGLGFGVYSLGLMVWSVGFSGGLEFTV